MTLFVQPNQPSAPSANDVWIRNDGTRQRWNGTAWVPTGTVVMPADPTVVAPHDPGLLPGGGSARQRLSKTGGTYGGAEWGDAAGGITFQHTQTGASDTWTVTHGLLSRYVHVTVIDTARNVEMVPEITYGSINVCVLKFIGPVTGIALVRR